MAAYNWDAAYATTSINSTAIAASAASTTGTIDNDTKLATEVTVEVAYGATITGGGVEVEILRDIDGTNFEATGDAPQAFTMPVTASTTHRRAITVPGTISRFQVRLFNPATNSSVTATVRTKQAVV